MYTGIVQSCRPIGSVEKKEGLYTFTIEFPDELLQELETGASVAVNGVCFMVLISTIITSSLIGLNC